MSREPTPGPWHVERWTDENEQPIFDDDTNDYVYCVCHPQTECNASTVVNVSSQGDAYLIAAAHDMMEALIEAEQLYRDGILATPNAQIERVHALRRAAFAKASPPSTPDTQEKARG